MGETIQASKHAVHLGNIIGPGRKTEEKAVERAVGTLYGRTNLLLSQFGHCSRAVKFRLFNSYCMDFYGFNLWNFDDSNIERIYVAWRKCIRRLFGLHDWTHCRLLPYIIDSDPIDFRFHKGFVKFLHGCMNSNNNLVKNCIRMALNNAPNNITRNISLICATYGIPRHVLENGSFIRLRRTHDIDAMRTGATIRDFMDFNLNYDSNVRFIVDYLYIN